MLETLLVKQQITLWKFNKNATRINLCTLLLQCSNSDNSTSWNVKLSNNLFRGSFLRNVFYAVIVYRVGYPSFVCHWSDVPGRIVHRCDFSVLPWLVYMSFWKGIPSIWVSLLLKVGVVYSYRCKDIGYFTCFCNCSIAYWLRRFQ